MIQNRMIDRLVVLAIALMIGLFAFEYFSTVVHAEEIPAPSAPKLKVLGRFKNTFYYYVDEANYPEKKFRKFVNIRDMNDVILTKVSQAFKNAMEIEGSGKISDGRMLNFAGIKNGRFRYAVTMHPYGRGVGNCPLVPFKTVAVDPKKIPLGSTVKIKETIGMKLPDGTIHDGIWKAEDIGAAIKSNRIDLFVGDDHLGKILFDGDIRHMQGLKIELVEKAAADSCIHQDPQ